MAQASLSAGKERVDLTQTAFLQRWFERAGWAAAVICTAGVADFAPWERLTEADWQHSLANKLVGQVKVVEVGAYYISPGGSIAVTAGVLAQDPAPASAMVSTVNAAVEAFVPAAALELGAKARVNAISPGWVARR